MSAQVSKNVANPAGLNHGKRGYKKYTPAKPAKTPEQLRRSAIKAAVGSWRDL